MSHLIDLSHPIVEGMPSYPGFPPPRIGTFCTHEESRTHYDGKAEFLISLYEMVDSAPKGVDEMERWSRAGARERGLFPSRTGFPRNSS